MSHIAVQTRKWLLRVLLPAVFAAGLFPRCANIVAPQGGPRDTLPPVVVEMRPAFGTKNFDEKRVWIEFDEYVKLQDLQKEFYTSPFMKRKPTVTVRGRSIVVDIQDTLKQNTTYSLNFASSVQDNNEGNPLHGLRYVFSTGEEIDSLMMSGYTVDAYTGDSVSKAFIFFYEAWRDSIPQYDSLLFNTLPDAVGRAYNNGIFIAENLKPIDYRVYAMQDNNSNQSYEPGVDRVGFLDTVFNPVNMEPFDIWFDTTRLYLVADPQLYFRMFMDEPFKRQRLAGRNRPSQRLMVLNFSAPEPQIEKLEFYNIDTSRLIREYLKPTRDSIAYWVTMPAEDIPDTIKGEIVYLMHDSINNLVPDTMSLNLAWKFTESKQQEKEREAKEKEREKAIAEGLEPEPEPNPFKVKVDVGGTLNPEKEIPFTFDYPLTRVDSARISLLEFAPESDTLPVDFNFVRDSMDLRKWYLRSDWKPANSYILTIPAGVFENIAMESNDTLRSNFVTMDPDKYSVIVLNITAKTPESRYVIQLLNQSGNVLQEHAHVTDGSYRFNYIDPGNVRIRVIEDDNDNGVWDKGSLLERRQSERVEIFYSDSGDDMIATKMNWEIDFNIDMNKLFAPVTMQKLKEDIRRKEMLRIAKAEKEREAAARSRPDRQIQERNQNQNQNDLFNMPGNNSQSRRQSGFGNSDMNSGAGNIRRF